ncbi:putative uncharacterized protein (plasmid) [Aliivibrio wodanis]|uniref:Uncharacterized protein n=1 Tax=Aliivibrio wodanis TaxID=80852 RepID=A0A090K2Q7_9GAMM|nr:putative uncharacterized protein [Aliivibrio wodanis]
MVLGLVTPLMDCSIGHLVNDICSDNCPVSIIALCPHGSGLLHDDYSSLVDKKTHSAIGTWALYIHGSGCLLFFSQLPIDGT